MAVAPIGLTHQGRLLWQFEALLHDTFGSHPVCASGQWNQKFTSGDCAPLAVYAPYDYVFARARQSVLHIASKKASNFGNRTEPVRVRGRNIACNANETTFLIVQLAGAHFSLSCSRAGWTSP